MQISPQVKKALRRTDAFPEFKRAGKVQQPLTNSLDDRRFAKRRSIRLTAIVNRAGMMQWGRWITQPPQLRWVPFPREIIVHCGWLLFRFCLSFRDIQVIMLKRGVDVSYLGDPLVVLRFGAEYARRLGVNRVVRDTWTSR